jgi:hypothetical protein
MSIESYYRRGKIRGWGGPELAREQWNLIKGSSSFRKFSLAAPKGRRRMMLHEVVRKVLGKDTENYPQEIGDCVSFGAKNAIEYLICCEKLLKGDLGKFRNIFPPYLYGIGRIYIGGGQLGDGDGSLGSWMADGVVRFGAIASDEKDVPKYSGATAKLWGGRNGARYLDKYKDIGKQHLVRSAAKISNWDELVTAICNGYPCTVASLQGFQMEASSDGFHRPRGEWAHQMSIIGVDAEAKEEYGIILNNWGDAHGKLKDFETGEFLPTGVLRVRRDVIESMIDAGETFAYSNFDDFEDQEAKLSKELFKLI